MNQTKRRKEADFEKYNQAFTRPERAKEIIPYFTFLLKRSLLLIESSAGAGDILRAVNEFLKQHGYPYRAIGYDIEPQGPGIIKQDFLKYFPSHNPRDAVVFGAPPIGHDNGLAIKFINHSLEYVSYWVIYVLPSTFGFKEGIWDRISEKFILYNEWSLPDDFFYLKGESVDEAYCTPVILQIWCRREMDGVSVVPVTSKVITRHSPKVTDDFDFLPRIESSPLSADAVIKRVGNAGEYIINPQRIKSISKENLLCLKVINIKNRARVMDFLKSGILRQASREAPGADSLSQVDVCRAYEEYCKGGVIK